MNRILARSGLTVKFFALAKAFASHHIPLKIEAKKACAPHGFIPQRPIKKMSHSLIGFPLSFAVVMHLTIYSPFL